MFDDGSSEDALAFGTEGVSNAQAVWLNRITVIPGIDNVAIISVAWGTPSNSTPASQLNGMPVTVGIWSDPNNDGSPDDAVLIASASGTIKDANTDTFVSYFFSPPVPLGPAGTNLFVGDVTPAFTGGELFYQAIDESSGSKGQSYLAAMSDGSPADINNLGNNDVIGTIDSFGAPGNFLIRADPELEPPPPTPTPTPTPPLWYNGDFDGVDGLPNEQNSFATGFAHVYDDFNVTDEAGWDVTSVFSNDLISSTIIGATWEIREGVSAGNEGVLVASGMAPYPNVTPTGRSGFGLFEFTIEVVGLSVHLPPGTYWLNVTPIGSLDGGRAFDSTTSGAHCVGTPCGNDNDSFWDSPGLFGVSFVPTDSQGAQFHDFSMGLHGTISVGGGDLTLARAASRKTHGSAGSFEIALPLSGNVGIEDRESRSDAIVLAFNHNVTGASGVSSSCGKASVAPDPSDPHNLIVTVQTISCDDQIITLTVSGVTDDQGNTADATVSYGKLVGDVDGNSIVNFNDAKAVRNASPRHATGDNFRADLNADGRINNEDIGMAKANRGDGL